MDLGKVNNFMSTILFPDNLVALRDLPGYFWNEVEKTLYSIKISGTLKSLKLNKPFYNSQISIDEPYYSLSKNGKRVILRLSRIKSMLQDPYEIPYAG